MNWIETYKENRDGWLNCVDFLKAHISDDAYGEVLAAFSNEILSKAAFRPQPTRGSAPQNPGTLKSKGDNL
jgi:hypothetical protein